MTRAIWLCAVGALWACDGKSSSGPMVGTETGNALTVAGSGATASAGVELSTARVEIASIAVESGACDDVWSTVAADRAVDALAAAERVALDGAVCGVRLQVARVVAAGTDVRAEATDFAITLDFQRAVRTPFVRLDVALWLTDLAMGAPLAIGPDAPEARALRRNVRMSATAHEDVDDDGSLDDDESADVLDRDEGDEDDQSEEDDDGRDPG